MTDVWGRAGDVGRCNCMVDGEGGILGTAAAKGSGVDVAGAPCWFMTATAMSTMQAYCAADQFCRSALLLLPKQASIRDGPSLQTDDPKY
jgi:hypothetical protein